MKKGYLILVIICLIITGCGKNTKKEETKTIDSKYINLNNSIKEEIESKDLISNITYIDDNMLTTEFGLNLNLVDNYISGKSETEEYQMYLVIKPKEGKEEIVKKSLNIYFQNLENRLSQESDSVIDNTGNIEIIENEIVTMVKNRIETDINGYYVYIISSSNEEILSILKEKLK